MVKPKLEKPVLKVSATRGVFHSIGSRNFAYYVNGILTNEFYRVQKGVDRRAKVVQLNLKTGQRMYLDYEKGKWLLMNKIDKGDS